MENLEGFLVYNSGWYGYCMRPQALVFQLSIASLPKIHGGSGIINLNNHNEDFGAVTFNGGEVDTGSGQFAIYQPLTVNPADSSAVINGESGCISCLASSSAA